MNPAKNSSVYDTVKCCWDTAYHEYTTLFSVQHICLMEYFECCCWMYFCNNWFTRFTSINDNDNIARGDHVRQDRRSMSSCRFLLERSWECLHLNIIQFVKIGRINTLITSGIICMPMHNKLRGIYFILILMSAFQKMKLKLLFF